MRVGRGAGAILRELRVRKLTSQGQGGRGRRMRVATSTMNKSKKRSHKKYNVLFCSKLINQSATPMTTTSKHNQ